MEFSEKHKIGMIQVCSTEDVDKNYQMIEELVMNCKDQKAEIAFLPESFSYLGDKPAEMGEPLDGPLISRYRELAKKYDIWLSLGGYKEISEEKSKVYNTHIIVDNKGKVKAAYRKIHLCRVELDGESTDESESIKEGKEVVPPVKTPVGLVGLTICYDIRFPELYRKLVFDGAEILTIPSAFLKKTGKVHWKILNQARAIENQAYIISVGQTGQHNKERSSYGHSIVVDPWGTVVEEMGEEVGCKVVEIDLKEVRKLRKGMPCLKQVRRDLY